MDYRLVKQFSNNAVDGFFNFFYKISDFFTIMIDCLWAFYDIWYTFVMIFVNLFFYAYYFFLYVIDRLTMSRSSVFFWRRTFSDSGARKIAAAYSRDTYNPVSRMYGSVSSAASNTVSTVSSAASAGASASVAKMASAASAVTSTVSKPLPSMGRRPEGAKKNFFKEFGEGFINFFEKLWKKISNFGEWFNKAVLSKLKPVRDEEPQGRKSLVESYVKEYEKKKR